MPSISGTTFSVPLDGVSKPCPSEKCSEKLFNQIRCCGVRETSGTGSLKDSATVLFGYKTKTKNFWDTYITKIFELKYKLKLHIFWLVFNSWSIFRLKVRKLGSLPWTKALTYPNCYTRHPMLSTYYTHSHNQIRPKLQNNSPNFW